MQRSKHSPAFLHIEFYKKLLEGNSKHILGVFEPVGRAGVTWLKLI